MTVEEAIEALKLEGGLEFSGKPRRVTEFLEGLDMAIKTLEKQIPKKHNHSGVTTEDGIFHPINGINGVPYDLCPNCGRNLCTDGYFGLRKTNYCSDCGQAILWEDEDAVN